MTQKVFHIVASVDTPRGRAPLEVKVLALDVDEAKAFAVKQLEKIGYENVALGFPPLERPKKRRK